VGVLAHHLPLVVGEYSHPTRNRDIFRAGNLKHLDGSRERTRRLQLPVLNVDVDLARKEDMLTQA
jgi:hypothetical protein